MSLFSIDKNTLADVREFLTFLAVQRRVSASTQNQAFNALVFFYRHVLNKEFGGSVPNLLKILSEFAIFTLPEIGALNGVFVVLRLTRKIMYDIHTGELSYVSEH